MTILVTGGAGYIGSHTCLELLQAGFQIAVIDNLENSSIDAIRKIEEYTGAEIWFYDGDIRNQEKLNQIFTEHEISAVIHFAAKKSITESVCNPLAYYDSNISGVVTLLKVMREYGCKNFLFSSSAAVYGIPECNPITEDMPVGCCTNAYARTKYMTEEILRDVALSDSSWNIIILRYFNPIGAHPSGIIGELPKGTPQNLLPYVTQVAKGIREKLHVFGNDYLTCDGTGVRDYIHVVDLAQAHVQALRKLFGKTGVHIYNLGTGKGCSVLELIRIFEETNHVKVPYEICERRPGDVAEVYCDPSKAEKELGWKAELGIEDMCRDAWRWEKNNG